MEEKPNPEQEVDGTSVDGSSQPEEGPPGKSEEKKAFVKNGYENNEGDQSSSEDHVQVDVTATPDTVRAGNLVSSPEVEFDIEESASEDEIQLARKHYRGSPTLRLVVYLIA